MSLFFVVGIVEYGVWCGDVGDSEGEGFYLVLLLVFFFLRVDVVVSLIILRWYCFFGEF